MLPQDPVILLSVVNARLRDLYPDLDELCHSEDADRAQLEEKLAAIVKDVAKRHAKGQPVLLGTASVESSEVVSTLLDVAKIPHQVLNAKQHEKEAAVVAVAGRKGAVTVATNMAGVVPTSCSAVTSSSLPTPS